MTFKKLNALFIILSTFSSSLLPADVFQTSGPEYERIPRNNLSKAAITIGAPYHLKVIGASLGHIAGATHAQHVTWGLMFTSPDKLTLKEAKPMVTNVTRELLKVMYKDPSFANYFSESLRLGSSYTLRVVTDNELAFRIDFWDENVDRPLYPYVAQIRLLQSKLYYHYADPKTQGLQEPFLVEPFSPSETPSL